MTYKPDTWDPHLRIVQAEPRKYKILNKICSKNLVYCKKIEKNINLI